MCIPFHYHNHHSLKIIPLFCMLTVTLEPAVPWIIRDPTISRFISVSLDERYTLFLRLYHTTSHLLMTVWENGFFSSILVAAFSTWYFSFKAVQANLASPLGSASVLAPSTMAKEFRFGLQIAASRETEGRCLPRGYIYIAVIPFYIYTYEYPIGTQFPFYSNLEIIRHTK